MIGSQICISAGFLVSGDSLAILNTMRNGYCIFLLVLMSSNVKYYWLIYRSFI